MSQVPMIAPVGCRKKVEEKKIEEKVEDKVEVEQKS